MSEAQVVDARAEITPQPASHRLLEQLLRRGEAELVARQLGLTHQTVRNWCRPRQQEDPNGTGRHNPLDDLVALLRCWLEQDGTWERPHRLARWFSSCCGGAFVPLAARAQAEWVPPEELLAAAVEQFGAFLRAVSACEPLVGARRAQSRAERDGEVTERAAALVSTVLALQRACSRW